MKTLTAPFINLNGNSKQQLLDQIFDFKKSLNETKEKLAKCDYQHGRNSIAPDHMNDMRKEKQMVFDQLHEISEMFDNLLTRIDEQ